MSTGGLASPKRRASSNSSQKQQTTLLEAFSNSKKKPRTDSPMLIDLTKTPASPTGRTIGGQRLSVKKLTIRNHKPRDTSGREAEYYENTFRKLDNALDLILSGGKIHGLQDLYKGCENLVRGGQADRCAKMATDKMNKHIKESRISLIQAASSRDSPVNAVMVYWRSWSRQIAMIRSILFYLDRTYLLSNAGRTSLVDTSTALFRTEVVLHSEIKSALISDLMSSFDECRTLQNGKYRQSTQLAEVMQMLTSVKLYDSFFEPYFLQHSEKFFQAQSDQSHDCATTDRLDLISSRLTMEAELGDRLLRPVTKNALLDIVKKQLIKSNSQEIVSGFDTIIEMRDAARLRQMHDLLSLVDDIALMRNAYADYVKKTGLEILSDKENDKTMVESLLKFKEEMDKVLEESFASEDLFSKALRDQFSAFINSRGDVPAEIMAKFIDSVLRSGNKKFDENDLERQMSRLMDIFRFIASKDVFEAFYKKDLAKRLLLNKSASADAERSLLAKLKVECGAGFTQKLEGMFKDIDISRDYGKNFSNKSLEVFVLSQGSWPTYPEVKVQIPEQMTQSLQEYQDYYLKSNNGRKLMWRHSLGHCQIKASFPKGDKELMVSLFQGLVILLFNGSEESLDYNSIKASTGLDDKELIRTLQSLACGKPENRVLVKNPRGKDVKDTDTFKVNDSFQNPKKIVKINQIQMKETAEENQATHDRVIQDRSFEIQAAIIRIMKSAKKKTHAELIATTIDTVKGRGVPNIPDIKKAIEKLLDREYLSRHDNEYHYEA
ncbi:protein of unknown function [Taphrina deformans PYCC 5710]|uniref:Cullin family profile domain-containing protein n=1 Tax=Taphrina deformans (strain PYCC 5710 / ATCC 11124 / CBS 356.35 / IMI 108563 / JCM 9778 / NBRC 8474) TaxID=1097556 RepID=R4XJ77_TAPDE|nr:protein of unknown function [Taphrina deformans PYCC 5710]|eukprot:CCG84529.1 protein of unknown function [Taphrina deformans PYCC 5710]